MNTVDKIRYRIAAYLVGLAFYLHDEAIHDFVTGIDYGYCPDCNGPYGGRR